MNHLQELQRIILNASKPGYFCRDQEGNEHGVSGYVVKFSYQAKVRGEEGTVTNFETAVVLAASREEAKVLATNPYKETSIISVDEANLGTNKTIVRIPQV